MNISKCNMLTIMVILANNNDNGIYFVYQSTHLSINIFISLTIKPMFLHALFIVLHLASSAM